MLRLADIVFHFEPADAEERIEAWCASVTGEDAGYSPDGVVASYIARATG